MSKKVTLVAQTLLTSGGRQYGKDMQFEVDSSEVEHYTANGQAITLKDAKEDEKQPVLKKHD